MATPRIVVERSPWQTFFEELPDLVLSFHKLKLQAAEAEKDRQFARSNMYIKDLQNTRKIYLNASLKAAESASSKGIAMDTALLKLSKSSPEARTKGGDNLNEFFQIDVLEGQINELKTGLEDINDQIMLANMGGKAAMEIDWNLNSLIEDFEIEKYAKDNPQLLEELGVGALPISYVRGAENVLTDPEVRKLQKEKAGIRAALNIMKGWDDTGVSQDQLDERKQAREASLIPGQSKKMIPHVIKAAAMGTSDDVGGGELTSDQKTADLQFRTKMDIYQDQITRTDEEFRASLPWGMGQDLKAKGFILNVDTHKANLEKTLETWFTKTTGWNTKREIRNKYAKYYNESENTGTEVEKRAYAVGKMLIDSTFMKLIDTDDKVQSNFGWEGDSEEEKAAVQIFRTTLDMYKLTNDWSGRVSGGGIAKMLEQQGIKKRTDINIDPVEDDWLYRERITK